MKFADLSSAAVRTALASLSLAVSAQALAQVTINEIDYDQPGSDTAEFIELYNSGAGVVNLSSYSLDLINGNNNASYNTVALGNVDLAAGDYFVVCADAANVANCDLEGFSSVQNGAPDGVTLLDGATIVDAVSYEGDLLPPNVEGSGVGLVDESGGGAGGPNDFKSIARFPDGNDSNVNNVDFAHRCMSPGEANLNTTTGCMAPAVEAIVVNEVDYQETGGMDFEFVELFNSGNTTIDLATYMVVLIDGDTDSFYRSFNLSGTLAAGDYYVVCSAGSAPNCDLDVVLGDDFIQNGSPDGVALVSEGTVIDTLSYGGSLGAPYTEGTGAGIDDPSVANAGLSRLPDGLDTNNNAADFSVRCATPGGANTFVSASCNGGASIEIHAIQGSGLATPFEDQIVTTNDNVVTGVGPEGFFIQTPNSRVDADPDTSQGIYVFTGAAPTVQVGDLVNVTGQAVEFFDFTEISLSPLVTVVSSGNPLPAPVLLDSNTPSPLQPQSAIELERYEGMLVSTAAITTGATDRFGDTPVTAQLTRAFREPGVEFPGIPGQPVWDGNPEVFEIDADGLGLADSLIFGGQVVTAVGPLAFSFGDYQIWPTGLSTGTPPTLPRAVRDAEAGEFTIATQNFERFFDDIDDPAVDDTVESTADYLARLEKVSYQIRLNLNSPDIVALQEIESAIVMQDIADRITQDDPGLVYNVHLIEGNDVGGIDVGFLTNDDTISVSSVTQINPNAILSFDGSLLNDRPPLQIDAQYTGGTTPFDITVINVHQRSLGGIDGSSAERVKTKRLEQSETLAQHIQALQTANPAIHLAVTGDFNAYEFTDGYVDVLGQITGNLDPLGDEFDTTDIVDPDLTNQVLSLPAEERYSFVFNGSAQVLDHTLTSSELNQFVTGFEFARANVDAPDSVQLLIGPGVPPIDDFTAIRSTDHDGAVLYIAAESAIDTDGDGVADDLDNCTLVANPAQIDTNGDGFGNSCDPDLDNNGVVNFIDLSTFVAAFLTTPDSPQWNPDADFNDSDSVNFLDFLLIQQFFLGPPGPSGLAP